MIWTGVLVTLTLILIVFMIWLGNAYHIDASKGPDHHATAAAAIAAGSFIRHVDPPHPPRSIRPHAPSPDIHRPMIRTRRAQRRPAGNGRSIRRPRHSP